MHDGEQGEPGKPGEQALGQQGGRGGEGGKGGEGQPVGGGGKGGEGGRGAQGRQGPKGEQGREGLPRLWKIALTVWIIVFSAVVIIMYRQNRHLANENRSRITDIQQSRAASCEQIYSGIRDVFKPFFPPKSSATPHQLEQLEKFNKIVDANIALCKKQIVLTD